MFWILISSLSLVAAWNPTGRGTLPGKVAPHLACSHPLALRSWTPSGPRAPASRIGCADAGGAQESKRLVSAALERFGHLAISPEGCSLALDEIAALKEAGIVFELGPAPHNRAMRVCSSEPETVEALYKEIAERSLQDLPSLEALASVRLEHGRLLEAAAATAEMLEKGRWKTTKSGKTVQRDKLLERTERIARGVLDACSEAGLHEEELSGAPEVWRSLGELGFLTPPPQPVAPVLERTLAILKPDCLSEGTDGEIEEFIVSHGFQIVRRRQWRMEAAEATEFLVMNRGSQSKWGNKEGRFFTDMLDFYTGGEVRALILEKVGAIAEWRELLGPADPALGRGYTDHLGKVHEPQAPESVRARWGHNKRANAAHGADNPKRAAREIRFFFGEGWSEAGANPEA